MPRIAKPKKKREAGYKRQEIRHDELKAIIERTAQGMLSEEEREKLAGAVNTLAVMTQELEKKSTSIQRLRRLLFGEKTEKTKEVLNGLDGPSEQNEVEGELAGYTEAEPGEQGCMETPAEEAGPKGSEEQGISSEGGTSPEDGEKAPKPKPKRKGHGRNGADAYDGAQRVEVRHESLQAKGQCPCCEAGKVYEQSEPAVLVRVTGISPLSATVYEKQRLRCNLCGKVFTAQSPEGVGEEKYDETAATMIGLLKYGTGVPFNRIERLGDNLGVPLPASTQWDVVEEATEKLQEVGAELERQAAQGDVAHVDDTRAKVLSLHTELQEALAAGKDVRTGVFTSGIVSTTTDGREWVVFYTGNQHAGENLDALMAHRDSQRTPPIQMSDALAANRSREFETILASCLVHARRNFVEVAENFPQEVRYVLEALGQVYKFDARTKTQAMTPQERLVYHQENSKPVMDELQQWLKNQFDHKLVEPNSSLGGAIKYMQNHWHELTLFLRLAGAPLDNNIVERALKRVILHRKNSLFFKTLNGARVGDLWMSLIYTAERQGENPFEYLVAIQRHHEKVAQSPKDWMPYNYRETMARLALPP